MASTGQTDVEYIRSLLLAKDDTTNITGLGILRTYIDSNRPKDQATLQSLWSSISPNFLDRLIRTGSQAGPGEKNEGMLGLAVAVIHTFVKLLPDDKLEHSSFVARIPLLLDALNHCQNPETTKHILELVADLVTRHSPDKTTSEAAKLLACLDLEAWKTLIVQVTQQEQQVFAIFQEVLLGGSTAVVGQQQRSGLRNQISAALVLLIESLKDKPAKKLLEFLSIVLSLLDPDLKSANPSWIYPLSRRLQGLAATRQTEEERNAFANCASALVHAYPELAPSILFTDEPGSPKPLAYLLVTMMHVDFNSTVHMLMPKLNSAEYPRISCRLASELNVLTAFVGFLVAYMEAQDSPESAETYHQFQLSFPSDKLLKVRGDIVRTITEALEFLRDRWDAAVAGARGLDLVQSAGPQGTDGWGTMDGALRDPVVASSIQLVGIWLRDDDGDALRVQAASLMDIYAQLYRKNLSGQASGVSELRMPLLGVFEGIIQTPTGRKEFERHQGWSLLYHDFLQLLSGVMGGSLATAYSIRGSTLAHVFRLLLENEGRLRKQEDWLRLVGAVASVQSIPSVHDTALLGFMADALQLAAEICSRVSSAQLDGTWINGLRNAAANLLARLDGSAHTELREQVMACQDRLA
ncbi:Neurochondrin-domain-containing protein [Xylariomycetidae sp. FL0641]|nr:Neurochondrin-domain-containing protein [Xylariomycetidae sp. FL0641]